MKHYSRLLAALVLLILAAVLVITTSFAWITLSSAPIAKGIQITISGSHTVLVAPDISVEQAGNIYHFPGTFSDTMNFSEYDQYSYLQQLGGLVPVSTADGETWYIPSYYQLNDEAVLNGAAFVGGIKPTTEFVADTTLSYANLLPDDMEDMQWGHYVYIDFWVVSPVDGYKLRVSTGMEGAGTFVIDLPAPEKIAALDGEIFELTNVNEQTAATVRLGFLVNQDTVVDQSMYLYTQSEHFDERYTRLHGVYNEVGSSAGYSVNTRFTIFEPNADAHPTTVKDSSGNLIADGQYVLTEPLGVGGIATPVSDRLSVQLSSRWAQAGEETIIAQMFRTFMAGRNTMGETAQSLNEKFYSQWLQYQMYPYLEKGNFIQSTNALYTMAGTDKIVQAEQLEQMQQAGATSDVYLTELIGGVPQKIRLFIWLEGQDVDCINSAAGGNFAISIELAGSNED